MPELIFKEEAYAIAGAAMDLFASTCVLSRQDAEIQFARRNGDSAPPDQSAAELDLLVQNVSPP